MWTPTGDDSGASGETGVVQTTSIWNLPGGGLPASRSSADGQQGQQFSRGAKNVWGEPAVGWPNRSPQSRPEAAAIWNLSLAAASPQSSSAAAAWTTQAACAGGGGSSPGGTFADVARKKSNLQQQQGGFRPATASRNSSEPAEPSWGKQVDQETPWNVGGRSGGVVKSAGGGVQWRPDGGGQWSEGAAGAKGWTAERYDHQSGWSAGKSAQPTHHDAHQWNTPPPTAHSRHVPNGWSDAAMQQQTSIRVGGHTTNANVAAVAAGWDPNPQTPSIWVPPTAQEQDASLMWQDPNPKVKKVLADKGTGAWGDPSSQGMINRWKSDDVVLAEAAKNLLYGNNNETTSSSNSSSVAATVVAEPVEESGGSTSAQTVWTDTPAAPLPASSQPPNLSSPPASSAIWSQQQLSSSSQSSWADLSSLKATNAPQTATIWSPTANTDSSHSGISTKSANTLFTGTWPNSKTTSLLNSIGGTDRKNDSDELGGIESEGNAFSSNTSTPLATNSAKTTTGETTPLTGGGQQRDLQQLTRQIAEQLRVAVQKGFVNVNIISHPLAQSTLLHLNQLLQRVSKLDSATAQLEQLKALQVQQSLSRAQQDETARLGQEIHQLRLDIAAYQQEINKAAAPPSRLAAGTDDPPPSAPPLSTPEGSSKSRLEQWLQQKSSSGAADSPATSDVEELRNSLVTLTMNEENVWSSGHLKPTNVDWSPPKPTSTFHSENLLEMDKEGGSGGEDGKHSAAAAKLKESSSTPLFDQQMHGMNTAVKEFVPGKQWEYHDPNEAAADPHATPGSVKPPYFGQKLSSTNLSSCLTMPNVEQKLHSFHELQQNQSKMFGFGGGLFSQQQQQQNVGDGLWGGGLVGRGRLPAQQFQQAPPTFLPAASRITPFNRSISSPAQSAFAPYGPAPNLLLMLRSNLGTPINEQALRYACTLIGSKVISVLCPPGQPLACVKFQETPQGLERIAHRLQTDFHHLGVSAQVIRDSDMESLLGGGGGRQTNAPPPLPPWASDLSAWPPPLPNFPPPPPSAGGMLAASDFMGLPPPPHHHHHHAMAPPPPPHDFLTDTTAPF